MIKKDIDGEKDFSVFYAQIVKGQKMKHEKWITRGFRIRSELMERIKKLCEKQDRNINWMVNALLEDGLKKAEK